MHEFGPFRADTVRRVLTRDGQPIPLTGKCFEILELLVRRAPETVSKDDLMRTVWADTFVEESNLTQHISMLRKALGETPQERLYIATVPGRGYRFVAAIREAEEAGGISDPGTGPAKNAADPAENTSPIEPNLPGSAEDDRAVDSRGVVRVGLRRARRKLKLVLTTAAAGAVLFAGAFYFRLHESRAARALGPRDFVLLADFENQTGEPVFDGPLREGTAVGLGQSPFLSVVADDTVRQTLRFMGRSGDEAVRSPLAREICERVGAKALIAGSIARLGNIYAISVEAVGCADGAVLVREQVEARSKEDVLRALGKVTASLRSSLGESLTSVRTFDVPMEQATTPSLEALKAYSLGVDERNRGEEKSAIPFFAHAIALDAKFAMAYAQLGSAYRNLGQTEEALDCFKRAYSLREKLSEREKLHLSVRYFETVNGDVDKAIETYEIWSRMFPRDPQPFDGLSGRYQVIGQYEKAVSAAHEALNLASNYYVPYDNLARSFLALNRFEDARQACKQAANARRDSLGTHRVLYYIAWIHHDPSGMQRELNWSRGTEHENEMLETEASKLMASGNLTSSQPLFQRVWENSRSKGLAEDAAYSMAQHALAEADMGDFRQARSEAATALRLGHGIDTEETAAEALALSGDLQRAQALVNELRQRFPRHSVLNHASLPSTLAAIELQRRDPAKAIDLLQQAAPYDFAEFSDLSPIYVRGLAYLRARAGKKAAVEFQKILDRPGINVSSPRHTLARLGLARAYALTGELQPSRENYERFLALWSKADTEIPVLREARQEYKALR